MSYRRCLFYWRRTMLAALMVGLSTTAVVLPRIARADRPNKNVPTHSPSSGAPLADRQAIIRDRIGRLEDRMFQLSQDLRKTEPDKSGRLLEGLSALRGNLVRDRIEQIVKLLREEAYSDAVDEQGEVMDDLQTLLKLLLEDPNHLKEREDEIEKLEVIRKALDRIIEEQTSEKAAAEAAEKMEKQASALDAAATKLKDLIKRQSELTKQSKQGRRPSSDMTKDQSRLRGETDALAAQVEKIADGSSATDSGTGQKGKDSAGQGESSESGGNPEQAAEDLHKASKQMKSAEEDLSGKRPANAAPAQTQARQHLERSLKNIKQQANEIRNKLKFAKQAERQRQTAEKTDQLSNDMKESPSGEQGESQKGEQGEQQGGKQGDQQGSKQDGAQQGKGSKDSQQGDSQNDEKDHQPMPGQKGVKEAVPLQKKAAEDLKKNQPGKAASKQDQAINKLNQARDELADRLDQLRREQQEELLAALESRFRAMLSRQLECNKATNRLGDLGSDNWKRSDQLELAELSRKQRWVADQADEAMALLVDEGSTVILPQLLKQVRDDGREVADLLAAANAGPTVRFMQADLEQVLRDIIGAVKKKQEELENSEGGASGDGGKSPPLLPGSAELKLLRACQLRVNTTTARLDEIRNTGNTTAPEIHENLQRLSKRQADIAEMAKDMHEALRRAQ